MSNLIFEIPYPPGNKFMEVRTIIFGIYGQNTMGYMCTHIILSSLHGDICEEKRCSSKICTIFEALYHPSNKFLEVQTIIFGLYGQNTLRYMCTHIILLSLYGDICEEKGVFQIYVPYLRLGIPRVINIWKFRPLFLDSTVKIL